MKVIIVVWDGLRPEFVNPELTPCLTRLAGRGVSHAHHSAIFPTETRVNVSSLATGHPPSLHGIVSNRFYDRTLDVTVNTGSYDDLCLIAPGDSFLPCSTFSESLQAAGFRTLIVGAGSPGSTILQAPGTSDLVVNTRGYVWPESKTQDVVAQYGPFPDEALPPDPWNDLAARILMDGLDEYDFGLLWLCDPDFTQHATGLGSETSKGAILRNDARLAKILEQTGEDTTVLVLSDHGFSTVQPTPKDIGGLDQNEDAIVKVGSSGLYLSDPDRDLERVVAGLERAPWVGPILTRDSGDGETGIVDGTFSTRLLAIDHADRSPDVVFSHRWLDEPNAQGVVGLVMRQGGTATHGSLSQYDRRAVFIAAGPGFPAGQTSTVPTSALDIAPTVLDQFGIVRQDLPGRVLHARSGTPLTVTRGPEVTAGRYTMSFLDVGSVSYLDDVVERG